MPHTFHCTDLDEMDGVVVGELDERNGVLLAAFDVGWFPFQIEAQRTGLEAGEEFVGFVSIAQIDQPGAGRPLVPSVTPGRRWARGR